MSNLSTLPKGDSAWLLRKAIERIIQQVSILETNIGSSTTGNSANNQVIFNDAGTLRGDSGLTFNKTTDVLSFGAGICYGDLTVDTSTLKVDSTNNRVGIGTATPSYILDIIGATPRLRIKDNGTGSSLVDIENGAGTLYVGRENSTGSGGLSGVPYAGIMYAQGAYPLIFGTNFTERYRIGSTGISTWSVAGTTAMTLDSTGLGIGAVANAKLDVAGAATVVDSRGQLYIHTTDAAAIDVGAQLTLGGVYTGSNNYAFGGIAARKENGTTNVAGYLDFLTTTSAGALTSRMRIDSSGNVGIGVTPTNAYSTSRALQIGQGGLIEGRTSDYTTFSLATNAYLSSAGDWTYSSNAKANLYAQSNGAFTWASVAAGTGVATFTPAMTLDASGNLLVGQTTITGANIDSFVYSKSGAYASLSHVSGTGSGTAYIQFLYNNTQIGTITQNGTTGVLYNIVSDYRLKESVKPISGGLARVNALKPSIYNWKSDGSTGEGFLAHELAEVVPFAVSGEKDAMNADGTIKSQGIDMSRIVPILVAAIQELTARVQTLEAR